MKYTVVLRRCESLVRLLDPDVTYRDVEADTYVAIGIEAGKPAQAVRLAKEEAKRADREDLKQRGPRNRLLSEELPGLDDYTCLVVFEGELKPVLFGWAAGGQGT